MADAVFGVWLGDRLVGPLYQKGDYTWFVPGESYIDDPDRPVLGLYLEEHLSERYASALRVPPWFSNLLPEGPLREWIARDRAVKIDREIELLAQVGHDLPGAVRVLPGRGSLDVDDWEPPQPLEPAHVGDHTDTWRFSLAGVGLKFSMLARGDRLTLPAYGEGGNWIVKFPDHEFADVPRNEYTMMSLAKAVGIEVPDIKIVHRDSIEGLSGRVWAQDEEWAYATRRFDRGADSTMIHIEDLAQVRNFYSHQKYLGNFETIAANIYRTRDEASLREFVRRLTFNILISNGDAHLKNWSLIYHDKRIPRLSPAYDIVATAPYRDRPEEEDLGLKFGGTRRFDSVTLATFRRLSARLNAPDVTDVVVEVVENVLRHWPEYADRLHDLPAVRSWVAASIDARSKTLLRIQS